MHKKLDFLIIGAQKAGTTSVYDWIGQHPDIYAPQHLKDFPFFRGDKLYSKGENFLNKQIGNVDNSKVVGAGSVQYLFFENIPKRIYDYNKNIKLIAILRNPIDRAISAYRYAVERGLENRTFSEAINYEIKYGLNAYKDYREANQKFYLKRGLYYQQLNNYYKYFSKDQILVLFFEELIKNKEQLLSKIFQFLEVPYYNNINYNKKNITQGATNTIIYKLIYSDKIKNILLINFIKQFLSLKLKNQLAEYLVHFNRSSNRKSDIKEKNINIETKDLKKLYDFFLRDINKLRKYSFDDLPYWIDDYKNYLINNKNDN